MNLLVNEYILTNRIQIFVSNRILKVLKVNIKDC